MSGLQRRVRLQAVIRLGVLHLVQQGKTSTLIMTSLTSFRWREIAERTRTTPRSSGSAKDDE
jgi:hypothetical protein